MRKLLYISILLLFTMPHLQAQKKYIYQDSSILQQDETTPDEEAVAVDEVVGKPDTTLHLNRLVVSTDSMYKRRNEKDFAYMKNIDSLLKAKDKEDKKQSSAKPRGGGFFSWILGSSFIQIVLWLLAIAFVLFIVYRLFLVDSIFARRRKKSQGIDVETEEEEIGIETDFEQLIKQALLSNNYRQAVRYQYLRTLHALAAKGYFELQPDKTNYQYVYELTNKTHQNDFAALTMNYEYVWYGEFIIDEELYRRIEAGFNNLNKKL